MKVLVTGGTGFLGRHLVQKILQETDWVVRLLVRDTNKVKGLPESRVEVVRGNMRNDECIRQATDGVNIVLHLATAMSGMWTDYHQETVVGTERILKFSKAAGVEKFIFISSIGVLKVSDNHFGSVDQPLTESSPLEDKWITNYIRSKIEAEKIVQRYVNEEGLDALILRPAVIWGPGGSMLLPRMGYKFGKLFMLVGTDDIDIPSAYVINVADAIVHAVTHGKKGEIYHILDNEPLSKFEYMSALRAELGYRVLKAPRSLMMLVSRVSRYLSTKHSFFDRIYRSFTEMQIVTSSNQAFYSNEKIRKEMGWEPKVGKQQALEATVKAFVELSRTPS